MMAAFYKDALIVVQCGNGVELTFPVSGNPRLAHGTPGQLNNIQISPFGLHGPDLDDDLALEGLFKGDYGQTQRLMPVASLSNRGSIWGITGTVGT